MERLSGSVALCALFISVAGCEASETAPAQPQLPPTEVTSLELGKAFDDNEAGAQQKYGAAPLLVSGTVTKIALDFSDDPVVHMKGLNEFSDVQLSLAEADHSKASDVKKGQELTLLCTKIGEVMGSPMLSECTFPQGGTGGAVNAEEGNETS